MADPYVAGYRGWPISMAFDRGTPFTGVLRFADVGLSAEMVDLTNQLSPLRFKEKLKGLRDLGQFTVELSGGGISNDTLTDLRVAFASDTMFEVTVSFTDLGFAQYWRGDGTVSSIKASGGVAERLSVAVAIEMSGPWTIT